MHFLAGLLSNLLLTRVSLCWATGLFPHGTDIHIGHVGNHNGTKLHGTVEHRSDDWPVNTIFLSGTETLGFFLPQDGQTYDLREFQSTLR